MNADLATQRALDRFHQAGFDALTGQEKVLAAVWAVESQVDNDGFLHFFSHAWGDLAHYAPKALTAIGALHMAGLVAKANAVFGPHGPPRDKAQRRSLAEAFSDETKKALANLDEQFLESPDETDALLEAYLNKPTPS